MRRIYCPECKVRMLVGDKLALCESCGKVADLGRRKPATYHHPLAVTAVLAAIMALVVAAAMR
jgi:uncharacterized paraquat-inducible protein A